MLSLPPGLRIRGPSGSRVLRCPVMAVLNCPAPREECRRGCRRRFTRR
jgi:hypothetical protein